MGGGGGDFSATVGFSGEAQKVETELPIGGAETGRQRSVKLSLHSDVLSYCR